NAQLLRIGTELQAPLLATNDSHYTHREDAEAHAALLCVQTGSTIDDPNRFKFDAEEFYLKSAAEMRALFADYPEACDNTLWIVDIDPIRYDLLFERMLNPGRKQMPDIDMDFDSRYRGEMIRYAAERYGWDRVAQVVTFSTIKARAAVRDAARVLGYPYAVGDKVAKAMPPLIMGRDTPLAACLELTTGHEDGYKMAVDLRSMYELDPDAKRVMDVAKGL